MEDHNQLDAVKKSYPEAFPAAVLLSINENETDSSHTNPELIDIRVQYQQTRSLSSGSDTSGQGTPSVQRQDGQYQSQRVHFGSVSMPHSPIEVGLLSDEIVFCPESSNNDMPNTYATAPNSVTNHIQAGTSGGFQNQRELPLNSPRINILKDKRYSSFKTWSGKLERKLTKLRVEPEQTKEAKNTRRSTDMGSVSAQRYFDALEGPELDTLRACEEIILPEDKVWPFLLRFPVLWFGTCLGVTSQALLWKTLATSASTKFLQISLNINLILWCIALTVVTIISFIYLLKVVLYFEAVRREYYHPIRINFFFAPWISCLFLALSIPPSIAENLNESLWYVLMTPIFFLDLKIYGQWMSGGRRRLSKVANATNHLAVAGNFVGALLGASMGLKEGPLFFFAVGLAHYVVLFVTLYQRLPTNETLPKELHPVFFLFVAGPNAASMAWAMIQGSMDRGSRISYFIGLFLYSSLAVRVNFFRGIKFSLAWWAYTFPMAGAAISTIKYCDEVPTLATKTLSVLLSAISACIFIFLLATTILHAFVIRDLFPNDKTIAISDIKPIHTGTWFHLGHGTSSNHDIQNFLQFQDSTTKDIEAAPISNESKPN